MLCRGPNRPATGEAYLEDRFHTHGPYAVRSGRHDLSVLRDRHDLRRRADEVPDRDTSAIGQDHERLTRHTLAKVRHHWALVGTLFERAVQLRKRDHRAGKLLGHLLQAP